MKTLALWSAVLALGFTLVVGDAEAARRLGGGRSSGMQREMTVPQKSVTPGPTAPAPNQATAPMANRAQPGAPAPQAQPKRSWMGPLAGLAAGLGLAALASHFGFGEGLASMLMIGLLIMVVLAVVGFIMRRRAGGQQPALAGAQGMRYAAHDYGSASAQPVAPEYPAGSAGAASPAAHIPADFDVEGFLRNAKVNFLRLQAANDAGNLEDIREFTSPEMFAEIKLGFSERSQGTQETDVVSLNAEVLDVVEEAGRYVVSVRFNGLIREGKEAAAEPFDEIWHLTKPRDGSRGWILAGIQQVQ
ncbi:MAG TPA: TIM44-like domain-containing protein [Rhodocyclaceae bacterium]|nr:TIM44-like domain-containing protein [Rhodocyclaceae bacterium]